MVVKYTRFICQKCDTKAPIDIEPQNLKSKLFIACPNCNTIVDPTLLNLAKQGTSLINGINEYQEKPEFLIEFILTD